MSYIQITKKIKPSIIIHQPKNNARNQHLCKKPELRSQKMKILYEIQCLSKKKASLYHSRCYAHKN